MQEGSAKVKRRVRLYQILENLHEKDAAAIWIGRFLTVLIVLSVLAEIFDTVQSLRAAYQRVFYAVEVFCVSVFSIEYIFRVWCCTILPAYRHPVWGRLRYMCTPMMVIDLISILPFVAPFLLGDLGFVRALRLLRLFRLLKLVRYSESLLLLRNVLVERREDLGITFVTLVFLLVFASSGMYFLEHDAQPLHFSSIPASMWWGVITLTTVGYGDVYPITAWGKVLGPLIAVLGIGMFAVPAGILASGFGEEVRLRKQRRRERLEAAWKALAAGGIVLGYDDVKHIVEEVGQRDAVERLSGDSRAVEGEVEQVEEEERLERLTVQVLQEVLHEKQTAEGADAIPRTASQDAERSEAMQMPPLVASTDRKIGLAPSEFSDVMERERWCYCPHCGGKLPPFNDRRK